MPKALSYGDKKKKKKQLDEAFDHLKTKARGMKMGKAMYK